MGRLVIVSNRVGSSLKGNEGGLATAMLAAFDQREVIWFGWSGEVTDEPSFAEDRNGLDVGKVRDGGIASFGQPGSRPATG